MLKSGIDTKVEALAHEALFAAKAITADPSRVRGGPWLRPTLSIDEQLELELVSKCTQVLQLEAVLAFLRGGKSKLAEHLGDVVFEPPRKQKQQTTPPTKTKATSTTQKKAEAKTEATTKEKSRAAVKTKARLWGPRRPDSP